MYLMYFVFNIICISIIRNYNLLYIKVFAAKIPAETYLSN